DPIGFRAGFGNLFLYAADNPISLAQYLVGGSSQQRGGGQVRPPTRPRPPNTPIPTPKPPDPTCVAKCEEQKRGARDYCSNVYKECMQDYADVIYCQRKMDNCGLGQAEGPGGWCDCFRAC